MESVTAWAWAWAWAWAPRMERRRARRRERGARGARARAGSRKGREGWSSLVVVGFRVVVRVEVDVVEQDTAIVGDAEGTLVLPERERGRARRERGQGEEEERGKARGDKSPRSRQGSRGGSRARRVSRAQRGRHDDGRVRRGVARSGAGRARAWREVISARGDTRDFERTSQLSFRGPFRGSNFQDAKPLTHPTSGRYIEVNA